MYTSKCKYCVSRESSRILRLSSSSWSRMPGRTTPTKKKALSNANRDIKCQITTQKYAGKYDAINTVKEVCDISSDNIGIRLRIHLDS